MRATWRRIATLVVKREEAALYSTTSKAFLSQRDKPSSSKKPKPTATLQEEQPPLSLNWKRPSEIPWQSKVVNAVHLIGSVQLPVQFQASSDGKSWAGTIITQSSSSRPFWIPVIFEGDLAHIAACHLREKDCVYITGQLSADPPPFSMKHGEVNVQVMARSINFVQGSAQVKANCASEKQEQADSFGAATKGIDAVSRRWNDLFNNPKQWWDYRNDKRKGLIKPKHPDFKHKDDNSLSLWVASAPKWVLPGLADLEADVKTTKSKQSGRVMQPKHSKDDEAWKNLVENPSKWWDNRLNKTKERAPDFKHKETGEALWLSDSPEWVLSKLPCPKARKDSALS